MKSEYKANSITLAGAIAMGTGVMIGAGIFALTGQIAQLAGPLFPLSFIAGAIVTAFSAYTYVKMSNAYPSAGGIAMILQKAYGPTTIAAGAALLMALSMVMFAQTRIHIPELFTGLIGAGLIGVALLSSIRYNRQQARAARRV